MRSECKKQTLYVTIPHRKRAEIEGPDEVFSEDPWERRADTHQKILLRGVCLAIGAFLSSQWNFKAIHKQQMFEPKWSKLLMPKLGLWRGTSERNIWRTTSGPLPQAELKEIYSVAGWPILLSVPIYIRSDKNFCQVEILITKMQVSVLGLTSISFLSPLSTLSLSWIMKPGGGLFWAWFMPRLSHVKTSIRSQLNLHGHSII